MVVLVGDDHVTARRHGQVRRPAEVGGAPGDDGAVPVERQHGVRVAVGHEQQVPAGGGRVARAAHAPRLDELRAQRRHRAQVPRRRAVAHAVAQPLRHAHLYTYTPHRHGSQQTR